MHSTIKIIELNEQIFTYTKVQLTPLSLDRTRRREQSFVALPFLAGIFFSTTKETKGHKGKKATKNPLCTSPALAPP